jgi:hypothetical protein
MKQRWVVVAAALLILISFNLTGSATAETRLRGWGNLQFGMTPDQVRALPGMSWSKLETKGPYHFMNAVTTTKIEDHDFKTAAYFDNNRRLTSVSFNEVGGIRPSMACFRRI